jgi:hypothetical protein
MNEPGIEWPIQIDRLSARNLLLTVMAVIALSAVAAGPFFFDPKAFLLVVGLFGFTLFGLLVPYRMQVDVGPGRLNVRTWWSVFRGDPGIERTLESEDKVVRYPNGRIRLVGRETTSIPVGPWAHRSLLKACRKSSIAVVDEQGIGSLRRSSVAFVVMLLLGLILALIGGYSGWWLVWLAFCGLSGRDLLMRL